MLWDYVRLWACDDLFTIFRCNELIEKGIYLLPNIFGRVCNGFCVTKEWKRVLECPKIHESYATLTLLIKNAIREKETNFVCDLIETLISHEWIFRRFSLKFATNTGFGSFYLIFQGKMSELLNKFSTVNNN